MDLVKDTQGGDHGVEIDISTGLAPAGGTITFSVINSGDKFVQVGNSNDRMYYNPHCPPEPPRCQLDQVDRILVYMDGAEKPDTWWCRDQNGHCHLDIGDQQ